MHVPGPKVKKSDRQKDLLWEIFHDHHGDYSKEFRKAAVKRTGLEWRKIYKWVFDNGLRSDLSYNGLLFHNPTEAGAPKQEQDFNQIFVVRKVNRVKDTN